MPSYSRSAASYRRSRPIKSAASARLSPLHPTLYTLHHAASPSNQGSHELRERVGRAEASVALTTTWSLVNAIRLPNASVKCQVSSRCDLFCATWYTLFCPYRLTTVFSGRVSSCIFILNFRAHAHYSISISIDFTLYTLHYK